MPSLFVTGMSAIVFAKSIITSHHNLTRARKKSGDQNGSIPAFASTAPWRFSGSIRFLRGGPVSWLQDLYSIPAVHPVWLNVDSVFRRSARFGGWCRLRRLNNDDLLIRPDRRVHPHQKIQSGENGLKRKVARASQKPWNCPTC